MTTATALLNRRLLELAQPQPNDAQAAMSSNSAVTPLMNVARSGACGLVSTGQSDRDDQRRSNTQTLTD
jgi:hypothetical protein